MPLLSRPPSESAPALIDGAETWSHARLNDAVDLAARSLAAAGPLGFLWCRNDRATIVGYLAALRARRAVALFDADTDPDDAAALVACYRPAWQLGPGPVDDDYVAADGGLPALRLRRQLDATPIHADLAVLLSTSGTTGSRKLVRLSAAAVTHNARAIALALAISPDARALTSLPLHYSYGLSVVASHLVAGAAVILTSDGLMAEGLWRTVREHRCTAIAAVPYGYQILRRLDLDRLDVPSVTTLTQAGGRLEPALVTHFAELMRRRGGRFHVMYGQTEATARMTVLPHEAAFTHPASVGVPLRDGAIAIDDGEIVYRGPNVMLGYATERADLGRGDDLHGVLRTGDLGFVDADGFVHVTGRVSRFAKVHGTRVSLDEVEALARLGRDDGPVAAIGGVDKVIVFCEGAATDALPARQRQLAARLRVHPSALSLRAIEALPRTASGKLDYARLSAEGS